MSSFSPVQTEKKSCLSTTKLSNLQKNKLGHAKVLNIGWTTKSKYIVPKILNMESWEEKNLPMNWSNLRRNQIWSDRSRCGDLLPGIIPKMGSRLRTSFTKSLKSLLMSVSFSLSPFHKKNQKCTRSLGCTQSQLKKSMLYRLGWSLTTLYILRTE